MSMSLATVLLIAFADAHVLRLVFQFALVTTILGVAIAFVGPFRRPFVEYLPLIWREVRLKVVDREDFEEGYTRGIYDGAADDGIHFGLSRLASQSESYLLGYVHGYVIRKGSSAC